MGVIGVNRVPLPEEPTQVAIRVRLGEAPPAPDKPALSATAPLPSRRDQAPAPSVWRYALGIGLDSLVKTGLDVAFANLSGRVALANTTPFFRLSYFREPPQTLGFFLGAQIASAGFGLFSALKSSNGLDKDTMGSNTMSLALTHVAAVEDMAYQRAAWLGYGSGESNHYVVLAAAGIMAGLSAFELSQILSKIPPESGPDVTPGDLYNEINGTAQVLSRFYSTGYRATALSQALQNGNFSTPIAPIALGIATLVSPFFAFAHPEATFDFLPSFLKRDIALTAASNITAVALPFFFPEDDHLAGEWLSDAHGVITGWGSALENEDLGTAGKGVTLGFDLFNSLDIGARLHQHRSNVGAIAAFGALVAATTASSFYTDESGFHASGVGAAEALSHVAAEAAGYGLDALGLLTPKPIGTGGVTLRVMPNGMSGRF